MMISKDMSHLSELTINKNISEIYRNETVHLNIDETVSIIGSGQYCLLNTEHLEQEGLHIIFDQFSIEINTGDIRLIADRWLLSQGIHLGIINTTHYQKKHIHKNMRYASTKLIYTIFHVLYVNYFCALYHYLSRRKYAQKYIIESSYAQAKLAELDVMMNNTSTLLSNIDVGCREHCVTLLKENFYFLGEVMVELSGGRALLVNSIHHINYCYQITSQLWEEFRQNEG